MHGFFHADEIVFLDEPGHYHVPAALEEKVTYVGPVLGVGAEPVMRSQSPARLGLSDDTALILVAPGGSPACSESRTPMASLVVSAFSQLRASSKRLVWIAAGDDAERVRSAAASAHDVSTMEPHSGFWRTMAGADVVVTKGNRITVLEAAALGIPSVSISFGVNPIDDLRVIRVRTNKWCRAHELDPVGLAAHLSTALLEGRRPDCLGESARTPAIAAARRVHRYLRARVRE
jgi:predicted glycosyltransferase